MGGSAVYLVKYYRRKDIHSRRKGLTQPYQKIPETTYDPTGSEGVTISRCQDVKEPQKIEDIHIAHAVSRIGKRWHQSRLSKITVFTTSWQFFLPLST